MSFVEVPMRDFAELKIVALYTPTYTLASVRPAKAASACAHTHTYGCVTMHQCICVLHAFAATD